MEEQPSIGPYALMKKIGTSDIDVSFVAEIPTKSISRRVVQISVIGPEYSSNSEFSSALQAEFKATDELTHMSIAQSWDLAERNRTLYICSELVDGISLRSALQEHGSLPIPVAVYIAAEVAGALGYAHSRKNNLNEDGIVHGSVRPRHISIANNGGIKLGGFAIARARTLHDCEPADNNQKELETVNYLSPAVARGVLPTAEADIFSVAALLYRMISDRTVYNQTTIQEVLAQAIEGYIPDIREITSDCPDTLAELIMRGLGQTEDSNFRSAQSLRSKLSGWLRKNTDRFNRTSIKEHFDNELHARTLPNRTRPLSRRGFRALDSASLIFDETEEDIDAHGSLNLQEVYALRNEPMPDEDSLFDAFSTSFAAEETAVQDSEAGDKPTAPPTPPPIHQRPTIDSREDEQTQEDDDIELISEEDLIDEPAPEQPPITEETDDKEIGADTNGHNEEREFRETIRDGRSHADKPISELAENTGPEGQEDSPTALDEYLADSSLVPNKKPTPPDASSPQGARTGTVGMTTLSDDFDEELDQQFADGDTLPGVADDQPPAPPTNTPPTNTPPTNTPPPTSAETRSDTEPRPSYTSRASDEQRPSYAPRSSAEQRPSYTSRSSYPQERTRPGYPLSSASQAESAIYDGPTGDSDDDDFDFKKPGRGSLGYLIIALVIIGVGAGAWFLLNDLSEMREEAQAEQSMGVFVTSRPQGAQIFLDSTDTGKTTPALIDIPTIDTKHRVSVELSGFETPTSKAFTSKSTRRAELNFELRPKLHLIHIESTPEGAEVFLEGESMGTTPMDLGPVRKDPREGIDLLIEHEDGGRKMLSHQWSPGSKRSEVSVTLEQ